ncbi:uncharacterized protein RJT20DRAFT_40292 [Scheffersomyces xylosifermentans]|uniref:uncharacterized protein n=1 Tax=Scheffersomyces xylosifermentans TaxID=1304137 RepID=UPI00315DC073
MGISQLWDVFKPAFEERVTIDKFTTNFIGKHGRTPRIAIDAYLFIMQSSFFDQPEEELWLIIRNFMAKILCLVGLNISFIIVFDGAFKPNKIRHGPLLVDEGGDYDKELQFFLKQPRHVYSEGSSIVEKIKQVLVEQKIDFLQSPAEAEAQCAYLQKFGIVDYVLSNDSDSFVFGATAVLRNFNRFKEDISAPPNTTTTSPDKTAPTPTSKYYVTPVHLDRIEELTGLTTRRLVFLATLRGGDYSSGVDRIGIKNAQNLALCGSNFAQDDETNKELTRFPRLPDLSQMLIGCFVKDEPERTVYIWDQIIDKFERKRRLADFCKLLNETIRNRSKLIFGRRFNPENDLLIDEYNTLLYLFPLVTSSVYKFLPQSLSFGELQAIDNDIRLPEYHLEIKSTPLPETFERINSNYSTPGHVIGKSTFIYVRSEDGGLTCKHEFIANSAMKSFSPVLDIPSVYRWSTKHLIAKLISYSKIGEVYISDLITISNEKLDDEIDLLMLKYDPLEVGKIFPQTIEMRKKTYGKKDIEEEEGIEESNSSSPTKSKMAYVWLPRVLIDVVNHQLVVNYVRAMEKKANSPKKKLKYSPQKTTLDSFGKFPQSPTKSTQQKRALPTDPEKSISLTKSAASTQRIEKPPIEAVHFNISSKQPKKSPRKAPSKKQIAPGQKSVDSFFTKQENPFVENPSLFLPESEDEEIHQTKDKAVFSVPALTKIPVLRPDSTTFTKYSSRKRRSSINHDDSGSPTKKLGLDQNEKSPFKVKSSIEDFFVPSSLPVDNSPVRGSFQNKSHVVLVDSDEDSYKETSSIMEVFPDELRKDNLTSEVNKGPQEDSTGHGHLKKDFLDDLVEINVLSDSSDDSS